MLRNATFVPLSSKAFFTLYLEKAQIREIYYQRIAYSRSSSLCPFLASTQKLQNSSFAFTSISISIPFNSFIAKTLHLISLLELA
ncbi:hypothetical protein P8452_26396 [Trifolium repens]|nr:hypothetical protein P8452_26396 [Trifolium repens]